MKLTNLVLLGALLCAPLVSRAVTVITSLPYTITAPGQYELKNNLTANGTEGIDVNASNVSINLAGYTITQAQTGGATGIYVYPNQNNVSIQDGTIVGFNSGVFFESGSGLLLKDVQLLGIPSFSVYVEASGNCLIENCFVLGTDAAAQIGIYVHNSSNVLVKNNQVSEINNGVGIVVDGQAANTLVGNYEANCQIGLNLNASKYQGNITTNCPTPVFGGTAVGQENG